MIIEGPIGKKLQGGKIWGTGKDGKITILDIGTIQTM